MAKGQKRSNRETKKLKSTEKKPVGPKYQRPPELGKIAKLGDPRPSQKK